MKSRDLILRCLAQYDGERWQAICLDFNLAAQAKTLKEAQTKLTAQIFEYVEDALVGVDQKHASSLLNRPAPAKYWAKYYYCRLLNFARRKARSLFKKAKGLCAFYNTIPMVPMKA